MSSLVLPPGESTQKRHREEGGRAETTISRTQKGEWSVERKFSVGWKGKKESTNYEA